MLGFAALIKKYPIDVDDLVAHDRPSHQIAQILAGEKNRLSSAFWGFHYNLKSALEIARMSYSITAISLSDSAFVATGHLHETIKVGVSLIQSLLLAGVPVRAGIAYGTFAAIRFKSDIGRDSGEHAAHFLGTGVVGAHEAESCGVKGIRILLHPSVLPVLDDSVSVLDLPEDEFENPDNRAEIQLEVDYWSFNVTDGKRAWHSLQDLWNDAPDDAKVHYKSTAEAVSRMRITQGFEPLKNLRRRTLPRK